MEMKSPYSTLSMILDLNDLDAQIIAEIRRHSASLEFRRVVLWLSQELKFLDSLQECIHEESLGDEDSFRMELSAFLREIGNKLV